VFGVCVASASAPVLVPLHLCVCTCTVSDIFIKFVVFNSASVYVWGCYILFTFWDVGAVSCFPLALVLCWCSVLSPVVFDVSCPVLAMLHFPEVLVLSWHCRSLFHFYCVCVRLGLLVSYSYCWGLGSFSIPSGLLVGL
jgi:hypothetical protein